MCTVSVITGENQYLLGMNRDEKLARGDPEPPAVIGGDVRMLFPRDVEGGTWVGVNEFGNAFGLLNWNDVLTVEQRKKKSRSRGHVIPHAAAHQSAESLERSWSSEIFAGMLPFRLVGVFPSEQRLVEWRWDMNSLETISFPWTPRHWFSSGLSDERAERERGAVVRRAWLEEDAGSGDWLRRLHRSHENGPGPFSVCVHRDEVLTLSYTEIRSSEGIVRMRYFPGEPCAASDCIESTL